MNIRFISLIPKKYLSFIPVFPVKTAVGTGLKVPSLQELYEHRYYHSRSVLGETPYHYRDGNPDLDAERLFNDSTEFEALDIFRRENVAKAYTQGVQLDGVIRLLKYFRIGIAYAYMDSKNEERDTLCQDIPQIYLGVNPEQKTSPRTGSPVYRKI